MTVDEIKRGLESCTREERNEVFRHLRKEFVIHKLEDEFRAPAEVILEAIDRAPDLTRRGMRGIIAEAVFIHDVLPLAASAGWHDTTPPNTENPVYDARLSRDGLDVRIQVKTQRLLLGKAWQRTFAGFGVSYVAETQRTRTGTTASGTSTRPYRADEFDILAVCMFPSTGEWREFRFALARDLVHRPREPHLLAVLQPVPCDVRPAGKWSADLVEKLSEFSAHKSESR